MSYREYLNQVRAVNDQFRYYKSIESLFELDQWSALPAEGGAYRQQMAAHVAQQKAALFGGADAAEAADYFRQVDLSQIEDEIERGLIRSFLFRYRNLTKTPPELMRQYSLIRAETMNQWKRARELRDFQVFRPWLEQVFSLKKQIALAIDPDRPAFETLVGLSDEGASCAEIDREFDLLRTELPPLVDAIRHSAVHPDDELLRKQDDPEQVERFGRRLAVESGYPETRGSFNNQVVHGFTSFLGPRDARVSTNIHGGMSLIFTYLHEAGHAMYAVGGSERVNAANLWGGIEGAFHEGMARFNENMVGRSSAYWEHYYPQLQEAFPRFRDVSREEFYLAANAVKPSLQRTAADEVTYSLHVILRYELERDCFSGEIAVKDLAELWNEKSEQYLGIRPGNDTEGILQDMHWAGDYIGYFQSYALGNIYCGQILRAVRRDIPDLDSRLAEGDFQTLNSWLDRNIRQYGSCFTAGEMIQRVTGGPLDARPYLSYLKEKYSALYAL